MVAFGKRSILAALSTFVISANAVFYTISPAPGDIVINGGFETGFASWTQSGSLVLYADPVNSFSGTNYVAFNLPTTVTQTITTQASTTYIITFHARPPGPAAVPNNLAFTLNDDPLYSITSDTSPSSWFTHTYAFTTPATGTTATSNTIGFSGSNDIIGYWSIDDISVIALPVPCDLNFYSFDSSNGHIKAESGKIYPSPPTTDTSFPVISNDGKLVFNYKSDAISSTSPRAMVLGLAPLGTAFSDVTNPSCQFTKSQATGCPMTTDITFSFSQGSSDPDVISQSLQSLYLAGCLTGTPAGNSITYSGVAFTLYTDPYDLGNRWSELKPVTISIAVPYAPSASMISPPVNVVSDQVSVSYLPVEVINDGNPVTPIVQFGTIATTFYPFVVYGAGTKFTAPPSGPPTVAMDTSGNGACVLYKSPGVVALDALYCDANPGICTIECTRTIPIRAPVCDMSGYDWTFAFKEFVDFTLGAPATTQSTDPTWASFTEDLLFDSSPQWNVCPSAASPNYASFVTTSAIHGHFDSLGNPFLDSNVPVLATAPLNFGFKISINLGASSNGVSATTVHIYKATLTEVKITGPHGDYYLVGSLAGPTVGGPGAGIPFVHGLLISPGPMAGAYPMTISPQTNPTDPKFAISGISFIPNQGDSGSNIFSNADGGGQTLTVTFAGVISLFADGSTPAKRDIVFRRQVRLNGNGTYADPSQVVNSLSKENSTTLIVQVPSLNKAVNVAKIVAVVVGALSGLCLLAVSVFFCRRRNKKSTKEIQVEEEGYPQK